MKRHIILFKITLWYYEDLALTIASKTSTILSKKENTNKNKKGLNHETFWEFHIVSREEVQFLVGSGEKNYIKCSIF